MLSSSLDVYFECKIVMDLCHSWVASTEYILIFCVCVWEGGRENVCVHVCAREGEIIA